MRVHRRHLLRLLPAAAVSLPSFTPLPAARARRQPAALLLPLTGPQASLGISMQRAATLVQPVAGKDVDLLVFDTGGTAQGAGLAAARAVKAGALMILGPVFGAEVRAAVVAAGRVPVLCFSNDEALRDSGAFLLGVTASQSTAAILGYARRRGVRRIAMLRSATPWGVQSAAAVARLQGELGVALLPVASAEPAALRAAGGGALPAALFVADGAASFAAAARQVQGSDVQLLGTLQALESAAAMPAGAQGAWIAAPDPTAFADFARTYEERNGTPPGAIAALAYDGANIAKTLRTAARLDRAGLLQAQGFPGVAGAVRFREDGSASRELAILVADASGYIAVPT